MELKETLNHNFSGILPTCAIFNGTNDEINFGKPALITSIGTSDFFLATRFMIPAVPASLRAIAGSTRNAATTEIRFGFIVIAPQGNIQAHLTFGSDLNIQYNYIGNKCDGLVHELVMNIDRDKFAYLYMDGQLVSETDISAHAAFDFVIPKSFRVAAFNTSTDTATLFLPGSVQMVAFGKRLLTSLEISRLDTIIPSANTLISYLNGHSSMEYDVSGNGIEGTWAGTGGRKSYLKDGYPYQSITGYSLYKKDANPDIQVSFTKTGIALVAPTVPAGYTKHSDVIGNSQFLNQASCLIDFDPRVIANVAVLLFKRSDETIHNATSRASQFYDVVNPYRWHVSELIDYNVYNSYFNDDYKDRLFSKVEDNLLKEILNCAAKQTGGDLTKAKNYCGIT